MPIDYVTHPSDGKNGYILEVFNAVGDSIAVFRGRGEVVRVILDKI